MFIQQRNIFFEVQQETHFIKLKFQFYNIIVTFDPLYTASSKQVETRHHYHVHRVANFRCFPKTDRENRRRDLMLQCRCVSMIADLGNYIIFSAMGSYRICLCNQPAKGFSGWAGADRKNQLKQQRSEDENVVARIPILMSVFKQRPSQCVR